MLIRKTFGLSLLLLAMPIAACTARPQLAPIPSVQLPTEVLMPVWTPPSEAATTPCAAAALPADGINTDLDGAIMTAREKVRADCNAAKLEALGK
jgi:hypothetical protein